jgi:hypothetical protein
MCGGYALVETVAPVLVLFFFSFLLYRGLPGRIFICCGGSSNRPFEMENDTPNSNFKARSFIKHYRIVPQ